MRFTFTFLLLSLTLSAMGQFAFQYDSSISLKIDGENLSRAWEGGINSAQFLAFDLNNDGQDDLVVLNRMSGELSTYLAIENQYVWAPEYKSFFPPIVSWMVFADYNCDGKKDIFTSVPQGITVYENITTGNIPEWKSAIDYLRFETGVNIQVNASDIPGIADVDGDGLLDLLAYRFSTASTIDYYEGTGSCGDLTFTRKNRKWGDFAECTCNSFAYGDNTCASVGTGTANLRIAPSNTNSPNLEEHAGGKTITVFDADNDGDLDLITSDEFCETLYFMTNEGTKEEAKMTSFISYPSTNPAGFYLFPSAFLLDINFDGLKDLVISSNADNNLLNQVDFNSTTKVYTNNGSNASPDFEGNSTPFFQHEMLDLGEDVHPALADFDNDGDLDLFIGTKGVSENGSFVGSIYLFENTGGRFSPAFELIDRDFANLKSLNKRNLKPQFVDIDGDGNLDFIIQATDQGNTSTIEYRLNNGDFTFGAPSQIAFNLHENDNVFFYDVDKDDQLDLIISKRLGDVNLFLNQGDFSFTEEIQGFAGITTDFTTRTPSSTIADLNNDGQDELIKIDVSGELKIYTGSISENFSPTNISTSILVNSLSEDLQTTRLSQISFITTGDIFGEGKPAILVGNNRGGIQILRNQSSDSPVGGGRSIELTLFPNPTSSRLFLRTDSNATLEMYTVTGQKIYQNIPIESGVTKEISTENLANGVYIIRVFNGSNSPTSKRIIIQK